MRLTYLLTCYLTHTHTQRGTPLSHLHCPVGQLRSNARLRLQLRRAFCGSELHGTATVQNAVALCSSFAPDAAAAAWVSCGLDARDGLLKRAIAACIRIARPRTAGLRWGRAVVERGRARAACNRRLHAQRDRKIGSGPYALRPIYATCKGLPPEGKLHCSHLSLQNASRLQRGIGIQ